MMFRPLKPTPVLIRAIPGGSPLASDQRRPVPVDCRALPPRHDPSGSDADLVGLLAELRRPRRQSAQTPQF
jgi:hypothetical protein